MSDFGDLDVENARELLKITEARNRQMLTIMHQYTNYVILILAGKGFFQGYPNLRGSSEPRRREELIRILRI
jgi:hypothetical protein